MYKFIMGRPLHTSRAVSIFFVFWPKSCTACDNRSGGGEACTIDQDGGHYAPTTPSARDNLVSGEVLAGRASVCRVA